MNLSNKLNSILKEYSEGNKKSAYKKFKKIYLQNNKDIKLRYNLAVMQQELGLLDEAETNYISLIEHIDEPKYHINLYNLYITKGFYLDALKIIDSVKSKKLSLIKVDQDRAYILSCLASVDHIIIFNEETPEKLICEIIPDILVKGTDYRNKKIAGEECMKENNKKIIFLNHVKINLAIKNISPIHARIEDFNHETSFDTVICRSYASLSKIYINSKKNLKDKGIIIAMKGKFPYQEIEELEALNKSVSLKVEKLDVPGLEAERHAVIIKK